MPKITEQKLKALISEGITSSRAYDSAERADKRQRELEYYQGKMADVPAKKGRSSVVSTDVADNIGWMLPDILRVFTASDQIVEYEETHEGGEDQAKEATDYINYVFWKDNDGYRILRDATHDSLLHGNGIVKHYWDTTEQCEYSEHSGLDLLQYVALEQDDDVEVLAVSQEGGQVDEVSGVEAPTMFDVKIKRITSRGKITLDVIAQEDFLIDSKALTIDDSRFTAQREETTRSDLLKRGFDAEKVKAIPPYDDAQDSMDELARDPDETLVDAFNEPSMEKIELYECYIKVDADGDGEAEIVQAYFAGLNGNGELLDWDIYDSDIPFSDIPCNPVPHRWLARSISDDTVEPQRIKTTLLRQALDNLYASNLPMREVEKNSVENMNMLLNPKFGGVIIRKPGTAPTQPHEVPFVAGEAFAAIDKVDQITERRTGVTKATMALDPQVLQNQSATANQNAHDAGRSQTELIARNQAELGWRRVFRQMLRLAIKHQDRERRVKISGEWTDVNPKHWDATMDATVNVGLGTGSRDRDMAMLNQILQHQMGVSERLAQGGFPDLAIDMAQRIQKTLVKIAESAGIKNGDEYYPEITDEMVTVAKQRIQQMQGQPDPKVAEARARAEADKIKAENDFEIEKIKAANELTVAREKAKAEMQLAREKQEAEIQLAREQITYGVNGGGLSPVRMGGDVG